MRDRLIELIQQAYKKCHDITHCSKCAYTEKGGDCFLNMLADHLLSAGVIVPPCKVGDTVYQTDGVIIYESCINEIDIMRSSTIYYTDGVAFDERSIGNSIFLTKEEAERALAERREG